MGRDLDPNYAVTAIVVLALVVVAAFVVHARQGGDARFEFERTDRTGSIRMRGTLEAPRLEDKLDTKNMVQTPRTGP